MSSSLGGKEQKLYLWTVIIYVLLVYAFYPVFHLNFSAEPNPAAQYSLYQYLTQSFLAGHFHLSVQPLQELLQLADPYNPSQNFPFRLHDASLYQGKYYLYFGPLPVILFYLPLKLATGFYPSDNLALFFFLSLAFLVNFSLLIKIKENYFPALAPWQLILAGFLIGIGSGLGVLFDDPRVYEVAIASAYCFMSLAFYFLYQLLHNQYKTKDVFLFSLCLALTVAGRPHFAIVSALLIAAVFIYLGCKAPKNRRFMLLTALLIPAMAVAFLLGTYNYLRFGSIFDFGHIWQLSCNDIRSLHADWVNLSKLPRNLWYSFYFYFLQPFTASLSFPYFGLIRHSCTYSIDKDYYLEAVAGVLTTTPLILLVLALPKLVMSYLKEQRDKTTLACFVLFVLFAALINTLFLLALPFAIQRYEVDFLPYLVFLAILSFWMLDDYFKTSPWMKFIRIFYIATALMSIILGLCFSMSTWVFV